MRHNLVHVLPTQHVKPGLVYRDILDGLTQTVILIEHRFLLLGIWDKLVIVASTHVGQTTVLDWATDPMNRWNKHSNSSSTSLNQTRFQTPKE